MLPVVAIVGRPNVGKSTLFNCLTRGRDALVADEPGLTRDRKYGLSHFPGSKFVVVDTGGLDPGGGDLSRLVIAQADRAIDEADSVLLVADARAGLTPPDAEIARRLRRLGKPVILVVNKTDGLDPDLACAEFHEVLASDPVPVAATHGHGIGRLVAAVADILPPPAEGSELPADGGLAVAVVGRPNAGKSTLVNRLVGEERVLAHDAPGTTRDSIYVPFERRGRRYTLIDTAGIRRRARVTDTVEKFSVVKSLQAIEAAGVAVLLVDASTGVTDQDSTLLGLILDIGRAFVVAANKWDVLDTSERRRVRDQLQRKFAFVDYARTHYVSARDGYGVGGLIASVDRAWDSASRKLSTPVLTRILQDAVRSHPPPVVQGKRIKLRYAHQGGGSPPRIVIHGNKTDSVPAAYERYLARTFRSALNLEGTPIRLEFRHGENPFADRRNVLSRRQVQKRRRLMRHVKGKR